jgi:hypothetical protein
MRRIVAAVAMIVLLVGCSSTSRYVVTMKDGRQFRVNAAGVEFPELHCMRMYDLNGTLVFRSCEVEKYEVVEAWPPENQAQR